MKKSCLSASTGQGCSIPEADCFQSVDEKGVTTPSVILSDTDCIQGANNATAGTTLKSVDAIEVSEERRKFIIPKEDTDDLLDEYELDIEAEMELRIRKPGKHEFFKPHVLEPFTTSIFFYKANPEVIDETIYYVAKELRRKLGSDMKQVKFYLCHSCLLNRLFIWPVKVSDTNWFRSLDAVLRKSPDYFSECAVRVRADKTAGMYQWVYKHDATVVSWPIRNIAELITDAIGESNIIRSPDHPIYQEVTSGEKLS